MQDSLARQTAQERQNTELEQLHATISGQNNRLIANIEKFESIGRRLKNTSIPVQMSADKKEGPKPDGLIQEIGLQLEYYQQHNVRLEMILEKFQSLL